MNVTTQRTVAYRLAHVHLTRNKYVDLLHRGGNRHSLGPRPYMLC
jgi:hypothetical protein